MVTTTRRLLVLVLAIAIVAGACGNSDDESSTETTSSPDAPDPTDDAGTGDDGDGAVVALDVPGVSDDSINFTAIGLNEGNPLGTCILDCYTEGIDAYFAWRNSEGGVHGRQLVLGDRLDDELARNQDRALEVIAADDALGVFNATLTPTGWADLDEAGIPTFVWGIWAEQAADRDAIFGHFAVSCFDCTQRGVPWAAREAGATKVASLGYVVPNSAACANAVADSIDLYSDDLGLELAYLNDGLAYGLGNGVGPEVTAMKEAGVDFISTCMDLNGMKTLAAELQRQGMGEVTLYHPNTYNQQFVADADGLFDGDYVVAQFVPFEYDTGLEMQDRFMEWMDAQGSEPSELAMIGWINADQAYEQLLAAGPEFDRQAVIDAGNAMTAYNAGGLINPIDWTRQKTPPTEGDATHDYALECISPVLVVDGAFEIVAEDETPAICWDNSTTDWSEPELRSYAD